MKPPEYSEIETKAGRIKKRGEIKLPRGFFFRYCCVCFVVFCAFVGGVAGLPGAFFLCWRVGLRPEAQDESWVALTGGAIGILVGFMAGASIVILPATISRAFVFVVGRVRKSRAAITDNADG